MFNEYVSMIDLLGEGMLTKYINRKNNNIIANKNRVK